MPWRRSALSLVLIGGLACTGCSTPASGADPLATGRARVGDLVNETTRSLPPSAHATTVAATGTTRCRRKVLGFAAGTTGRHVAEAPVLIAVDAGTDPKALLDPIEKHWQAKGYTVDRANVADGRYPKITAHTPDGYSVT